MRHRSKTGFLLLMCRYGFLPFLLVSVCNVCSFDCLYVCELCALANVFCDIFKLVLIGLTVTTV